MKKNYVIRCIFSLLALGLWIASLFLPVAEESGAGTGHVMSGGWVLAWTFTWGVWLLVGLPWAVMNVWLIVMFIINLTGRRYAQNRETFLIGCGVITLMTIGLGIYGIKWQYGALFWLASLYLMGFTALGEKLSSAGSPTLDRAT